MSNKIKSIVFGVALSIIMTTAIFIVSAFDTIEKMMFIVLDMFKYIGVFFIVLGVGQLFIAYRDNDIDSKAKAIACLALGICLSFVHSCCYFLCSFL